MGRRFDELTARVLAASGDDRGAAIALGRSAPKSGARVAAGHRAQAFGDGWERYLRDQHAAAWAQRLAHLTHVGPPHRRTGPGGREIKIVGNGPADFQGEIRGAEGRPWLPLAVEAKSLQERLQRDDLEPHQRDDLARKESVGGVGLVVLELHDARGVSLGAWAIPWGALETRWRRTARVMDRGKPTERTLRSASAGPAELEGWEIGGGLYLARFAGGDGR